jgi:hypothetical protein
MKKFASTLSSRGWALLVLSGGLVLAAPFFKGSDENKPQYTSVNSPTHPIKQLNSARGDTLARALNTSPPLPSTPNAASAPNTIATAGLPHDDAVELSTTDRLQSVAAVPSQNEAISNSKSISNAPTPRASIDSSAIVVQPPSSTPRIAMPSAASQILADAAPINTELPAWARKPSMSETLISSSSMKSSAEQAELGLPPAKKPSAYRAWTAEPSDEPPEQTAATSDRFSPFIGKSSELVQRISSNSVVRWPDEDPRTAIAAPKADRLVGRDAIIRNPTILKSLSDQPGRIAVHTSNDSPQVEFRADTSNQIVQPKFGQATIGSTSKLQQPKPTLRSKVPPDEGQFIR